MSNLWDISNQQGSTDIVVPGDTMHAIYWNAVAKRGSKTMMREKEYGIWRAWTWAQAGTATREVMMGLVAQGFKVGHQCGMDVCRLRGDERRGYF
jgi:long-chain acyl-CoA synthetase